MGAPENDMKKQLIGLLLMMASIVGASLSFSSPSIGGIALLAMGLGPCILVFPGLCLWLTLGGGGLLYLAIFSSINGPLGLLLL
jgi:hypothetical protein